MSPDDIAEVTDADGYDFYTVPFPGDVDLEKLVEFTSEGLAAFLHKPQTSFVGLMGVNEQVIMFLPKGAFVDFDEYPFEQACQRILASYPGLICRAMFMAITSTVPGMGAIVVANSRGECANGYLMGRLGVMRKHLPEDEEASQKLTDPAIRAARLLWGAAWSPSA